MFSVSDGQPLSKSERAYFEPRFGVDFSQVRLHRDAQAAESARALNAKAYTVGQDVVFGTGQDTSRTSERRRLMTHELTHVIQQQHSSNSAIINRYPRVALEELTITKGKKSEAKSEAKTESGVKICYVLLSVFPDWLPNWAAGFTMLGVESKEDVRIISPEVMNTSEPRIDSKYQIR